MHGEFFNAADSIKQNKELVFHTVNGREVYGGGGIMPDIFVRRDTTESNLLQQRGLNKVTYHDALRG